MDDSIEAVYGNIVIKFRKFLVEKGVNVIIVDGYYNLIYAFADTVGEVHGSNCGKMLLILAQVEPPKFIIPIKARGYLMESCQA